LAGRTHLTRVPRVPGSNLIATMVDVRAVKQQLRLLGHVVADDTIESFIQGLHSGQGGIASLGE